MPRDLVPLLLRASAITTVGAAVLGCSSSDTQQNPPVTPADDGAIDQGSPDIGAGGSSDAATGDRVTPLDAGGDCPMVAVYGPQPCSEDTDCQQRYGAGWYCDKAAGYTNSCSGEFLSWPLCEPLDSGVPDDATDEPMTHYGPMPVDGGIG
jgi:hypothetical protein